MVMMATMTVIMIMAMTTKVVVITVVTMVVAIAAVTMVEVIAEAMVVVATESYQHDKSLLLLTKLPSSLNCKSDEKNFMSIFKVSHGCTDMKFKLHCIRFSRL